MTKMVALTTSLLVALAYFPLSTRSNEWSPGCRSWPRGFPKQHADSSCDRSSQNDPRALYHKRDVSNPQVILGLPEEKTSICPSEDDVLTADDLPSRGGHESRWIVHNDASTPIVLSWVDHRGIEVSAADSKTTPPEANAGRWPHGSMLAPGLVAIVNGYQGHTFLARQPAAEGGRVLLKHRTGLVYVRNEGRASCPENRMDDPVPEGNEAKDKVSSPVNSSPDCNFLQKGFINKVGCGIDLYFATGGNYTLSPQSFPKGHDAPHCERFTGHLGVNPHPTNYMTDHSSPVKFEVTYATHRFVARMSHDNSFVAEIPVDHDVVHDCPSPGVRSFKASVTEMYSGVDVLANGVVVVVADAAAPTDVPAYFGNVTEPSSLDGRSTKHVSGADMRLKPVSHEIVEGGGRSFLE